MPQGWGGRVEGGGGGLPIKPLKDPRSASGPPPHRGRTRTAPRTGDGGSERRRTDGEPAIAPQLGLPMSEGVARPRRNGGRCRHRPTAAPGGGLPAIPSGRARIGETCGNVPRAPTRSQPPEADSALLCRRCTNTGSATTVACACTMGAIVKSESEQGVTRRAHSCDRAGAQGTRQIPAYSQMRRGTLPNHRSGNECRLPPLGSDDDSDARASRMSRVRQRMSREKQ